MSSDPPKEGKSVFVGNIAYQLPEEEIIKILSKCGQVVSFRLVSDPQTGQPKGYGFCEYIDKDAAASAIRNLNGELVNNRPLKVDYSHQGPKEDNNDMSRNNQQQPQHQQQLSNGYSQPPPPSTTLPVLPPGTELPAGLTCPDAISKTIGTLPTDQLLNILSQMKGLAMNDPAKATELLRQAPQLSFAIFQALLLLGLVDTTVLASVVEQAPQPPPPQANPPPPNMPPSRGPPQGYNAPPPPMPPQQYGQYGIPGHVPTPPVHGQPYQPPPMQQQPPPLQQQQQPPPPPQPGLDRDDLLNQVLNMPQQQVDSLPPAQRDQIMQLKRAHGRY
ncbi:MAG: hypothetical protein Q9218_005701 [Villophora microphyllina]